MCREADEFDFYRIVDGYKLVQSGVECKSNDHDLSPPRYQDATACAIACNKWGTIDHQTRLTSGCKRFIFGTGDNCNSEGCKCWWEYTTSDSCPEGFESDNYDFYSFEFNAWLGS